MAVVTAQRTRPLSNDLPLSWVSIHDVMPESLDEVANILKRLETVNHGPVGLLVVPGLAWQEAELAQLRTWSATGHTLVGHGWLHDCGDGRKDAFHRLHSALISRNVAEHLSRRPTELRDLVARNFRWFGRAGLPDPVLYVPPAWAMGRLREQDLQELPFRYYETLRGIYDSETRTWHSVPLMGFEADTAFRALSLATVNWVNGRMASYLSRPVRIAIHPHDFSLRLARGLERAVRCAS